MIDVLVAGKVCVSKREARELMQNGSISINGEKVVELEYVLSSDQALFNHYTVIKKGKTYFVVNFGEW